MRITQQAASGLFFLAFGALFLWLSTSLPMGTAADMGVGYTPRLLAIGCQIVGGVLLVARLISDRQGGLGSEPVSFAGAPLLLTTVMVAGFAVALPWLGLPLTVVACVVPAAIAGETFRWPVLLAIAGGLAVRTTLLFAWALRLQIPVWPAIPGLSQSLAL